MIASQDFMPCLTYDSGFYVKIKVIHDYGLRFYAFLTSDRNFMYKLSLHMIASQDFMPCLTYDSGFYMKIKFIHDCGLRCYALFDL